MTKKPRRDRVRFLTEDSWGGFHWKPGRAYRPHWRNVALGKHRETARREAARLNRELDLWAAAQGAGAAPAKPGRQPGPLSVGQLVTAYRASSAWKRLRPRSQHTYGRELERLVAEFGHDRAAMLDRTRVLDWLEELALTAPSSAQHLAGRGRGLFTWAMDRRLIVRLDNPFARPKVRGGKPARSFRFTWADVQHLLAVAEGRVHAEDRAPIRRPSVAVALAIAFATVQRITDVIRLHDGLLVPDPAGGPPRLRFDQSKRLKIVKAGELVAHVTVDMRLPDLVADLLRRHPPRLGRRPGERPDEDRWYWVTSEVTGEPYHEARISRVFAEVLEHAIAVDPKRWAHLRGGLLRDGRRSGFVHRIGQGATVPQVCALSGHSLEDGFKIVEIYLPRTPELADQAEQFLKVTL